MNCKELSDQDLIKMMRSESESVVFQVINCFNSLFYSEYLKVSWNVVFHKRNYAKQFKTEVERDTFNDGLNEFYFFVRNGQFVHGPANLQTVFLTFCKYKLLGRIKKEEYSMKREVKKDAGEVLENISMPTESPEQAKEDREHDNMQRHIFSTAWQELGERCRNLLLWRKIQKLSNEDIQMRSGISLDAINNEVYRCFLRLKKNADKIMYNQK